MDATRRIGQSICGSAPVKTSPSIRTSCEWAVAAKTAGMHTIAVTNTYDAAQLSAADKIVPRLDTLTLNALTELCA